MTSCSKKTERTRPTRNPFLNFFLQYRKTHPGNITDIASQAASEWNSMSLKDKEPYRLLALKVPRRRTVFKAKRRRYQIVECLAKDLGNRISDNGEGIALLCRKMRKRR